MNFKILILSLLFFLSLPLFTFSQSQTLKLSFPKRNIGVASADGKLVFAGGRTKFDSSVSLDSIKRRNSTVDIYDPVTESWTQTSMLYEKVATKAVAIGTKVYIGGMDFSTSNTNLDTVEILDLTNNSWSKLKLPNVREVDAMAETEGTIVFIDGGDVDIYNTLDSSWTFRELEVRRGAISAIGCNGKIFLAGGGFSFNGLFNNLDIYDVESASWTTDTLSQAKARINCECVGGKVYFIGGEYAPFKYSDLIEIYDTELETWDTLGLQTNRIDFGSAVANNHLFVAGGLNETNRPTDLIEIIDLESGERSSTALTTAKTELSGIALGNKVYFAGGDLRALSNLSDEVDVYEVLLTNLAAEEESELEDIMLFPNPAKEEINISGVDQFYNKGINYQIFDVHGRLIQQARIHTNRIGIQDLPKGFYTLQLDQFSSSFKFIKK